MSYEGYNEWLCRNGHYNTSDAYQDDPKCCRHCKEPLVWSHSVDCTNGELYNDDGTPIPSTHPYPLEQVGFEEVVTRRPLYRVPPTAEEKQT